MTTPALRAAVDDARPVNAFTVDVEDWYQVADFDAVVPFDSWDRYESRVRRNTDNVLELCAERGVKGTFFMLTWNAERHPDVVRQIHAAGHEVATHGYAHRIVYEQSPDEFSADVARAKKTLEDITGEPSSAIARRRSPSPSGRVGARRPARPRLPLRLERVPGEGLALRHARRRALPVRHPRARRPQADRVPDHHDRAFSAATSRSAAAAISASFPTST